MIFDYLKKLERKPQVILPKDAAIIINYCPITKESIVIDAGSGSGYFAIMAGMVAKKVISYEIKEEFAKIAKKNIEKLNIDNVEIIIRDVIRDGFEEERFAKEKVDVVFLDLPNSHLAIKHAIAVLKESGVIVGYFPNIEQLKEFVLKAKEFGWEKNYCVEIIERKILVREIGCRPENIGLMHSGYLAFIEKGEEVLTKIQKKRKKKIKKALLKIKNAEGGI
ncbi:MAG: methyltransferase domain-containing protein [Candidatus Anstonellaceae archaeon]